MNELRVFGPGDPSKPFEDASMEAAKTWDPAGEGWVNGGGGTPWDTDHLRSRPQYRLRRHRQRLTLESQRPRPSKLRDEDVVQITAFIQETASAVRPKT